MTVRGVVPWALSAAFLLGGCTNALYFYETGKISLTLEGRPDSTEPVQGNLGFKQRTAVVAPGKLDGDGKAVMDSGSMISSFRFGTKDKISIHTALITGQAARCLDDTEAQEAATAIVGVPPIPGYDALAKSSIDNARTNKTLPQLIAAANRPYSELSDAERTKLGGSTITATGDYTENLHKAIRQQLEN